MPRHAFTSSMTRARPSVPVWLLAAATLLACAAVVRRQTMRAEAAHRPAGRFVPVQGLRLHYVEQGDPGAPPLVLLHGNGTMADDMVMSGLVDRLAERFRVIVFDRPGFGHSERPRGRSYSPEGQARLLVGAMTRLGVERAIVFGHSWGAMVALAMGLSQPQSVRALVLASGYYTPSVRLDVPWLSTPAVPGLGWLLRHTVSPLLSRALWPLLLRRMFGPPDTPAAFREDWPVWMSLRPSQLRAAASETAMMIPQAVVQMRAEGALPMPVVIVAGEQDRLVSTAWHSARLHRRVPGSRLRTVPGAGHMVHHTHPEAVVDAIDEAARLAESPGTAAANAASPDTERLPSPRTAAAHLSTTG